MAKDTAGDSIQDEFKTRGPRAPCPGVNGTGETATQLSGHGAAAGKCALPRAFRPGLLGRRLDLCMQVRSNSPPVTRAQISACSVKGDNSDHRIKLDGVTEDEFNTLLSAMFNL